MCNLLWCPERKGKQGSADTRHLYRAHWTTGVRLTLGSPSSLKLEDSGTMFLKFWRKVISCRIYICQIISQMWGWNINIFRGTKSQSIDLLSTHYQEIIRECVTPKRGNKIGRRRFGIWGQGFLHRIRLRLQQED